jgi:hypothetical protein
VIWLRANGSHGTGTFVSDISILLLTYGRLAYATRTLETVLNFAHTNQHTLSVHIASDGDENDYVQVLRSICMNREVSHTVTNSQRGGYGHNYNLATQVVHQWARYVLPLEDDWELVRPLDLDLFVGALDELNAGCMRLGYIGYTQALRGEFERAVGRHWLRLDPQSPEPHIFAGHPRIETVEWEREVGPWPEGMLPGDTEFAVAHYPEARHNVIWPIQEVKPYGDMFVHIGAQRSW